MYFKKLFHPEYYQGAKKTDRHFEGWYYKLVSKDGSLSLALIPGVAINKKDPHAFIQVFSSRGDPGGENGELEAHYRRFPLDAFKYRHDVFEASIGKNRFTANSVDLAIEEEGFSLSGHIELGPLTPIKKSLWAPNIMGPFAYLSFMECYHGVISMDHGLDGRVALQGEVLDFSGGSGYIEKDWGVSFPVTYVWIQSNHFTTGPAAFMFSAALIPLGALRFKGLICNLIVNGKEYRFATWNGSRILLEEWGDDFARYRIARGKLLLDIEARSTSHIALASPREGEMKEHIKEGLSGTVTLRLFKEGLCLWEGTGSNAGIEIMMGPKTQG